MVQNDKYKSMQCIGKEFVTVPGKRDQLGNFFKIELLLQQERVGL